MVSFTSYFLILYYITAILTGGATPLSCIQCIDTACTPAPAGAACPATMAENAGVDALKGVTETFWTGVKGLAGFPEAAPAACITIEYSDATNATGTFVGCWPSSVADVDDCTKVSALTTVTVTKCTGPCSTDNCNVLGGDSGGAAAGPGDSATVNPASFGEPMEDNESNNTAIALITSQKSLFIFFFLALFHFFL